MRPDFRYRIPARSGLAGEFRGIDGFVEVLTRLGDESAGTIELTPVAVLADDENLIARARVTAQRGGERLDTENCYVFWFLDGKVADGQVFFFSDPEHVEKLWTTTNAGSGPRRRAAVRGRTAPWQRLNQAAGLPASQPGTVVEAQQPQPYASASRPLTPTPWRVENRCTLEC